MTAGSAVVFLSQKLPYDPAIPLLDIYLEKTTIQKDTCTPMFPAALFTISRTWKQPGYLSADEWINCYIYNGIYSTIKRNNFESVVVKWMNLEPVIQNEISQKEKN